MFSIEDEPKIVGLKSHKAYVRAQCAAISAWGQGVRQERLRGDALEFAELSDSNPVTKTNVFREKHQRGLDLLPFDEAHHV